ncbi:MAG: PDZ domain-containing protein, partial [Planctomycetales bacterium]|nr:PDZ domain-containing protein [Planctomycetales bacterium]
AQRNLGVTVTDADWRNFVPGVMILAVDPYEPAQLAGLEPQDVILAINGRPAYQVGDVVQAVANSNGFARITLRNWRDGRLVTADVKLDWLGAPISSQHGPPDLAQELVDRITRYLGMPSIVTRPTGPPDNAVATMETAWDGSRIPVILYDGAFLNDLYRNHGRYASLSVLAHEVAHHFHGDATFYGSFTNAWTQELKADYVSGFVLARAGATLEQTTRAIRYSSSVHGSASHPDMASRLMALEAGWHRGKSR